MDSAPFDPQLIDENDPAPYRALNTAGDPKFLLICDHASHAVPAHMARLGLSETELTRHIGWDIGAAEVTGHLTKLLNAPAFLAGYSRLLIDCNRPLTSPTSIPAVSDKTPVPANQGITEDEATARADACYWPYHNAIAAHLDALVAKDRVPLIVAVHSFTPEMDAFARPWQVGLLYEHDDRLVAPLHEAFVRLKPGIVIGDNEPYAIRGPSDYSIPQHGQARGLPHIELEIRQDLIGHAAGAHEWAALIAAALTDVYAALAPFKVARHAPGTP